MRKKIKYGRKNSKTFFIPIAVLLVEVLLSANVIYFGGKIFKSKKQKLITIIILATILLIQFIGTVYGFSASAVSKVGVLAGTLNNSTIENISIDNVTVATSTSGDNIGGLFGQLHNSRLENAYATGNIRGGDYTNNYELEEIYGHESSEKIGIDLNNRITTIAIDDIMEKIIQFQT